MAPEYLCRPQSQFAERNQNTSVENASMFTNQPVGDQPSKERKEIDKTGKPAIQAICVFLRPAEPGIRTGQG